MSKADNSLFPVANHTHMRLINRWRKRLRALVDTNAVNSELDEELAFHLEMETSKNLRAGMSPEEASRQAKLAFGAVAKHREATREARWLSWFPDLSLDVRLGARMLVKYPGITIIGGFAMAFAIWVGCVTFEMTRLIASPSLPLPDGDRIVQISTVDVEANDVETRVLHDFLRWRGTLRAVTDLGAYRNQTINLIAGDARPIEVAEMTASGFAVASQPALLGRALLEEDELTGAPPVVVLGHDVWRTRFGAAKNVIGRSVQLGDAYATVVGVMPEGFEFPVAHDAWIPLRLDGLDKAPRVGPSIHVFARLAPDVSMEEAQTELTAAGQRMAAESPATHRNLQPKVAGYTENVLSKFDLLMSVAIPAFAVMLLILVCSNVALLMFARAATREGEMIVRSALGASRRRIVIQLFAEALVLGGLGAALGLAAADFGLRQWGTPFLEANMGRLPFWIDVRLSPATVLYAAGLTVLAAVIAGVIPALKVTNGISSRLRQATAGAGGLKFGGVWTAVIVTQVAFTTAFPAMLLLERQMLVRVNTFDAGFPAEEFLAVYIEPDAVTIGDDAKAVAVRKAIGDRFLPALERLRQRITTFPEVTGVTFVDRLPRAQHRESVFELDEGPAVAATTTTTGAQQEPLRVAHLAFVDHAYFNVLQAPMLAGRAFQPSDFVEQPRVIIVDQGFVDLVLDGRNPVGRRIRYVDRWAQARGETPPPQPWLEIIGVVKELGTGAPTERARAAGVYTPVTPGHQGPTNMMIHLRGDPSSFISTVRRVATEVDPTLRLSEFQRVDQVTDGIVWVLRLWLKMTALLTVIALVLSLAGIYAVMSFTVSRRTREIGIRVALGANARSVVAAIFRRPLMQVGAGVAIGAMLAAGFLAFMVSCQDGGCEDAGVVTFSRAGLLVFYALVVLFICLMACVVPTRRALAIQPTEALRTE
jgi:predicted permease